MIFTHTSFRPIVLGVIGVSCSRSTRSVEISTLANTPQRVLYIMCTSTTLSFPLKIRMVSANVGMTHGEFRRNYLSLKVRCEAVKLFITSIILYLLLCQYCTMIFKTIAFQTFFEVTQQCGWRALQERNNLFLIISFKNDI